MSSFRALLISLNTARFGKAAAFLQLHEVHPEASLLLMTIPLHPLSNSPPSQQTNLFRQHAFIMSFMLSPLKGNLICNSIMARRSSYLWMLMPASFTFFNQSLLNRFLLLIELSFLKNIHMQTCILETSFMVRTSFVALSLNRYGSSLLSDSWFVQQRPQNKGSSLFFWRTSAGKDRPCKTLVF